MAKRKANSSLFQQTADESVISEQMLSSTDNSTEADLEDRVPKNMSQAVKEKLDTIEDLQKANSQLFQEKSDLQDKLAQYIDELASKNALIKGQEETIQMLNQKYGLLQEEYDKTLLTVSQLSYENSQLKSVSQKVSEIPQNNCDNSSPQQYAKNVSYNTQSGRRKVKLIPTNGYGSWN